MLPIEIFFYFFIFLKLLIFYSYPRHRHLWHSGKATNTNFIVFGSNPQSTALEVSMLTITPPIRFILIRISNLELYQYLNNGKQINRPKCRYNSKLLNSNKKIIFMISASCKHYLKAANNKVFLLYMDDGTGFS